jgi:nitroimidazol reductase NimA-like FMN-containing flavoprotein (pyridoxamine 5'-phosphate oxidase superfamily)
VYEDGVFYFTTRLSRVKGRHVQSNPSVALSIATDQRPYRAVCAFGQATIVKQGRDEWLKQISTRYGAKEAMNWLEDAMKQPGRVVFMMKPDRILSWDYSRGDSEKQEKGESMATIS